MEITPKIWSNTSLFAKVLPNRLYQVIVDRKRKVTLRNREFLRTITLIIRRDDLGPVLPITIKTTTLRSTRTVSGTSMPSPQITNEVSNAVSNTEGTNDEIPIAECLQLFEQSPIQP